MRYAWSLLVVVAMAFSGCTGNDAQDDAAPGEEISARDPVTWSIDIQGSTFVRGSISIQAGDTVHWTNRDSGAHTVTADDGTFDSGDIAGTMLGVMDGATFEFTFGEAGSYPYHCDIHPSMQAAITVLERFDGTP